MWQLYALGAMVATAGENVIDKAALIRDIYLDPLIATFIRPFIFFVAIALVGLTGWLGDLHFFFNWVLLLCVPFGILSSFLYTYLLQKIEITSIGAAGYLTPFLFFFIDTSVVAIHFSLLQVIGIVLLVLGGIGFSLDARTHMIKRELTWRVWVAFALGVVTGGVEAYAFKYVNATEHITGVTFFTNLWFVISLIILLIVIARGKLKLLLGKSARAYISRVAVSKFLDAGSTALWAVALTLAAVSQVSAFETVYPVILLVVATLAQLLFRLHIRERLDRDHIVWKICSVCLLVAGGFLVS